LSALRIVLHRPLAVLATTAVISVLLLGLPQGAQEAHADTTIAVGDLWFCNSSFQNGVCETVINQGETVTWNYAGGVTVHNSRECGANCSSPSGTPVWQLPAAPTAAPWSESFTFNTPGTYLYRCDLHTVAMRGRIVVLAPQPPSVGGIAELPEVAQAPSRSSDSAGRTYAALVGGLAVALAAVAAGAWYAKKRWLQ
jgi:plastocyanin